MGSGVSEFVFISVASILFVTTHFPAVLFLFSVIYNYTAGGGFRNAQTPTLRGKLPLFLFNFNQN